MRFLVILLVIIQAGCAKHEAPPLVEPEYVLSEAVAIGLTEVRWVDHNGRFADLILTQWLASESGESRLPPVGARIDSIEFNQYISENIRPKTYLVVIEKESEKMNTKILFVNADGYVDGIGYGERTITVQELSDIALKLWRSKGGKY